MKLPYTYYRTIWWLSKLLGGEPTSPRTRSAAVYARQGSLYFCPMSETTEWLWMASPPFHAIQETTATDEDVGRLLQLALDGSRQGVRHPPVPELERVLDPLLHLAGIKSYRTFEKGARNLDVFEREGRITIMPTRNAGKDGFIELCDRNIILGTGDKPALGRAIRAALERCE